MSESVRVLIFKDGDHMVAQCLEHDIAAQGRSHEEVRRSFEWTYIGHVVLAAKRKRAPFADLPKAPEIFWKQFESARNLGTYTFNLSAPEALSKAKKKFKASVLVAML